MIAEVDSFFRVDTETFDFYLAFRDQLSKAIEIDGLWMQIFFIDFEQIRKKLRVDKSINPCGWHEKHINDLPRALRQLKNLKLVKRLSRREFLIAKRRWLWRFNGQFPKRLYEIKWADSSRFLTPTFPLLRKRKTRKILISSEA